MDFNTIDSKFGKIYNAYDFKKIDKQNASDKLNKSGTKKDLVALSSQAKDFQSVMKALASGSAPDVREDKVNSLKAKIDSNEYNISSSELAKKMLSKAVF